MTTFGTAFAAAKLAETAADLSGLLTNFAAAVDAKIIKPVEKTDAEFLAELKATATLFFTDTADVTAINNCVDKAALVTWLLARITTTAELAHLQTTVPLSPRFNNITHTPTLMETQAFASDTEADLAELIADAAVDSNLTRRHLLV